MNGTEHAQAFDASYASYFSNTAQSSPASHLIGGHSGSPNSLAQLGLSDPMQGHGLGYDMMRPSSSGGSNLHLNISNLSVNSAQDGSDGQQTSPSTIQPNVHQQQHNFLSQAAQARLQGADLMLGGGLASSPHSAGASPTSEGHGLSGTGLPASPSTRGKSAPGAQDAMMLGVKDDAGVSGNAAESTSGPPSRSFSNQSIKSTTGSNAADSPASGFGHMSGLQGGVGAGASGNADVSTESGDGGVGGTSFDDSQLTGQSEAELAAEKRQSSKFVYKLFRMVSDPDYQHLISWNRNGTSVMVCNFDEFAKEVLGKHFKHSNFSSFIRQLNMYGFYKVNKTPRGHRQSVDTQIWEFSHPKFLRGRPDLLDDIRRKALDSEHARVEARDLQYSVSVGQMQLRQQFEEMQFRLDELTEQNMALRNFTTQLRDVLGLVLEHTKKSNGGRLPFDVRMPTLDMPSPMPPMGLWTPQMHDGPPIFVTEPELGHHPQHAHPQHAHPQHAHAHPHSHPHAYPHAHPHAHDGSGSLSRRVSGSSAHSDAMMFHGGQGQHDAAAGMMGHAGVPPPMGMSRGMAPKPALAGLAIDTSAATMMFGQGHAQGISPTSTSAGLTASNAGLGVMSLPASPLTPQHQAMFAAINTPLPPSPAPNSANNGQFGQFDGSPFLANNGFAPQGNAFAAAGPAFGGGGGGGEMGNAGGMYGELDDGQRMGPNAKAMRTPLKRTASNSGPSQQGTPTLGQGQQVQVQVQVQGQGQGQEMATSPGLMKRKSPV